ncbi:hypothetical protein ISS04_03990 [Candidatus Woesearchaeota archaeon]|nr:hypothetical protein [Candidatus Woesearchaeota archaeon]
MSALSQRFLGCLRFKGQIKELISKIDSLHDISSTQYDGDIISNLGYSENRRFEEVQGKLFSIFTSQLFAQYNQLASQLIRTEEEQKADRIRGNKTINNKFAEFEDYLSQMPIDIQRKKILTSFSTAKERLLSAISGDLPYSITNQRWDLKSSASQIESSLKARDTPDFIKELDMKKLDVFRNNAGVREKYGKGALDLFNDFIRGEIFDRLLVTPESTDESVNLGYNALWFKDAHSIAYNLVNFWREVGYSGEQPFLSFHSSSENTQGVKYIESLTDEQLSAVEQLKIPGLMDVINTVKEHSTTFRQSYFIEGGEKVDNPVYERVQEDLGKICSHYLEHGSEREKYFSLGLVANKLLLHHSNKKSEAKLTALVNKELGIQQEYSATFRRFFSVFSGDIGTSLSGGLSYYKLASKNYNALLDVLLEESTASRFESYDFARQNAVKQITKEVNNIDSELTTPLIRKVIEKEKSFAKLKLLEGGISLVGQYGDLGIHLRSQFQKQPNAGYDTLNNLCLVKPILNEQFGEDISRIFHNDKNISEYTLGSKTVQSVEQQGLSKDQDILDYCNLIQLQGKKIKDKKVLDIAKLKGQISRFGAETEQNPENEDLRKQLNERKDKLGLLLRNERTAAIDLAMLNSCSGALNDIVGEPVHVTEINEDLINGILIYHQIRDNKQLLSDLIKDYVRGNPTVSYTDEKNQEALQRYASKGIDTNKWVEGITRTYSPELNKGLVKEKEDQIRYLRDEVIELFAKYDLESTNETISDSYKEFRQRLDIDGDVKRELKTQLNTIKSLENQIYNSKIKEVTIYAEKDPMKVLQMGNVVSGSCLGLGKENSFSTVANAVDSNKHVLYAKMNGEIVGRKLIALNDAGEIVQFKTFNNRLDLNMDDMFGQYLNDLSIETNAKLGDKGNVSRIVAPSWYDDGIRAH